MDKREIGRIARIAMNMKNQLEDLDIEIFGNEKHTDCIIGRKKVTIVISYGENIEDIGLDIIDDDEVFNQDKEKLAIYIEGKVYEFIIPDNVKLEKTDVTVKNGVVTINIPRKVKESIDIEITEKEEGE